MDARSDAAVTAGDGDVRPARVLWLVKGLGAGGAERLLCSLAAEMNPDQVAIEAAYVLSWKDALVSDLAAEGVPVHALGVRRLADLRWLVRLRSLVARGGFDVVHSHSPIVASAVRVLTMTLPRGRRPSLMTTEHSQWSGHPWPTRLANRVTFGRDAVHLAVAALVRGSLPPGRREDVEVLHHGVSMASLGERAAGAETVRDELGVAADEVLVVTVANLRRHKGYPDLLEAAAHLAAAGTNVRFVAIGQGPLADELRARATQLGLDDATFTFLGYRADAPRYVAAADLFVLASVVEGLPIAVVEALALGVPVVATAVGAVTDLVTDGVDGLLVAPGQPGALANALGALAGDPDRRRAMGEEGRRRAAAFGIDPAARRHEELYRALAVRT